MSIKASAWKRSGYPLFVYDCIRNEAWVPAEDPLSVTLSAPLEGLSVTAQRVLGENGVARFQEFREYQVGWDFGEGEPLARHSVQALEMFLSEYSHFARRPSLFLTRAGNLMLAWEDAQDNRIELECVADAFLLYLASDDAELSFRLQDIPVMLQALPHPSANVPS